MRIKLIALLVVIFSSIAIAAPGVPHLFYGSVTLNSAPAPDGTTITAKINGIDVASTTTLDGKYGYSPIFYIPDPNNIREGDTISFFVNGVNTGQTYTFSNHDTTELNLTVTITTTTVSNPSPNPGPGPTTTAPTTSTVETTTTVPGGETTTSVCEEKWKCSDWAVCQDGIQTRLCYDENNCGTDYNKPLESNPCSTEEAESPFTAITGMLVSSISNPIIALPIAVGLSGIVIFFGWKLKTKKKNGYNYKPKKKNAYHYSPKKK